MSGDATASRALVEHHDQLPVVASPPAAMPDPSGHGHTHDHPGQGAPPQPPQLRSMLLVVGPILLILLGLGAWRHHARAVRATEAQRSLQQFVPTVRTTQAMQQNAPVDLTLPGQAAAFDQAQLFPRATGYVAERRVDIGSRVKRGDLMMRISAPELDQQLAQAVAMLGQLQARVLQAQAGVRQAQANTKLADVNRFRATTLATQGWETRQNADRTVADAAVQKLSVDSAQAGVKVADADLRAQLAAVQRLRALTAFERVVAPFDGVVTARTVDTGDLVTADASGGAPLFTVQADDMLRVSVQVPQSAAIGLRTGQDADITVPEMPGYHARGTISRSSVALAAGSRSLTAEIDVPNADHRLRPGLYVNVTLHTPRDHPVVTVPADALVFGADGMRVAVVQDGIVHLRKASIGRDFGETVELASGLQGGETVALGLPAGVEDGGKIKVEEPNDGKAKQDKPKQ